MSNNLLSRLQKISDKLSSKETYMIYVSSKESLEEKVKIFNSAHNLKLNFKTVANGNRFPFKNGYFYVPRNWSIADLIIKRKKDRENKKPES